MGYKITIICNFATLPSFHTCCLCLATEVVRVGAVLLLALFFAPLFFTYVTSIYVLGIDASLTDHFRCICLPVGIECSSCACMVLHIRSRQKVYYIIQWRK